MTKPTPSDMPLRLGPGGRRTGRYRRRFVVPPGRTDCVYARPLLASQAIGSPRPAAAGLPSPNVSVGRTLEDVDRSPKNDGQSVALDHFPLNRGMWAMTITLYVFFSFIGLIATASAITEPDAAGVAFMPLLVAAFVFGGYWLGVSQSRAR